MCRPGRIVLVLCLAAWLTGLAPAQAPGFWPGEFGGSGLALLLNKSVQEELKLDSEQIAKLARADKTLREKYDFAKLREMKPEEREEFFKNLAADTRKITEEVLRPVQRKRLKQIELLQKGVAAFADEDVHKTLMLSDEQAGDIKDIAADFHTELEELRKSIDPKKFDVQALKETLRKMQALREESTAKAVKLLSTEQRKKWKELTGERFEVKWELRPPGPPRSSPP